MAWKLHAIEQTRGARNLISTQVRWGFEGLAVNEFEGLEFKPFTQIGRPSLKTGSDALARLSFEDSTIRRTAVAQGAILGACYLQTYRVLKNARPRYATLKRAIVEGCASTENDSKFSASFAAHANLSSSVWWSRSLRVMMPRTLFPASTTTKCLRPSVRKTLYVRWIDAQSWIVTGPVSA